MEEIQGATQYSTARTSLADRTEPGADRARGGTVSVTLIIPPERIGVQGGQGGFVDIPQKKVTFTIDMEQLPLVDVSRYKTTMVQIAPAVIPYPAALPGGSAPLTHTFG